MRLEFGAMGITGPDKTKETVEDAYFYTDGKVQAFGIADGLGGWNTNYKCSPAPFARRFIEICDERVKSGDVFNIAELLNNAYAANDQEGGASVVLAMFNSHLDVANLGDCGLRVIRNGKYFFRTEEMSFGFNSPYYVGKHRGEHRGVSPLEARLDHVDLKIGDVIVMGSDGLFDNVYRNEIIKIAGSSNSPGEIASGLAERAFLLSLKKDYASPFTLKGGEVGGKQDDITVIVAKCIE